VRPSASGRTPRRFAHSSWFPGAGDGQQRELNNLLLLTRPLSPLKEGRRGAPLGQRLRDDFVEL